MMTPHLTQALPSDTDPLEYWGTVVFDWLRKERPGNYSVTAQLRFRLSPLWSVVIPEGWEIDGASGPAIDGVNNMLAALVHDALYWIIRHGDKTMSRRQADKVYREIVKAQLGGWYRAWVHYVALRLGGGFALRRIAAGAMVAALVSCGCRTTYVVNVNTKGTPRTEVQQGKAVPLANGISAAVGPAAKTGSQIVDLNDMLKAAE